MAGIRDQAFMATCGRLATHLNLSAATARQRVDYQAAQEGIRDAAGKLILAERMLEAAKLGSAKQGKLLDAQLNALESEANFMDED
ncbi:MAG: hypothetical protein O2922_00430 [Cyanobacteria bacterium]|jgi:hypothetical protein|nr:hypothetical protein [Cyanobacteriota bacterium]